MSLQATSYVLHRRFGNHIRKLLMIGIADFANDAGEAWPSIDTLAARAECSRRSVQEHLAVLEGAGDLEIRANAGPKGTHRYRIIFRNPTCSEEQDGGVQDLHGGCKRATPKPQKGGANGRRPFAPESSGTVREPSGVCEERTRAASGDELEEGPAEAELDRIRGRVGELRREWNRLPAFTARERVMALTNAAALGSIDEETWDILGRFMRARLPEGHPGWQPLSRYQFLESPGDAVGHAVRWHERQRPREAPRRANVPEPAGERLSAAEVAKLLRVKS